MSQISAEDGIIDVSGIFRDVRQALFIDDAHPDEQGNRMIAERMSRDVLPWLARKAATPEAASGGK